MTTLSDTLPRTTRLQLALWRSTPVRLAQTFALYAGQFANRREFDMLAQEISQLYDLESVEHARCFRTQLDRRLCDRHHAPVAWRAIAPQGDHLA